MSSMRRSIRRSMAKKNGSFTAQKPLRDRHQMSFREMLLSGIRRKKLAKQADLKEAK